MPWNKVSQKFMLKNTRSWIVSASLFFFKKSNCSLFSFWNELPSPFFQTWWGASMVHVCPSDLCLCKGLDVGLPCEPLISQDQGRMEEERAIPFQRFPPQISLIVFMRWSTDLITSYKVLQIKASSKITFLDVLDYNGHS